MYGKTHVVHGAIWGLGVGLLAPSPGLTVLCAGAGAIAALGPDVDHKPATAGRLLPPVRWFVQILSWMCGLPKHRGITHTVLFAVAIGAVTLFWLPWALSLSITAGWLAALVGDWATKTSLPYVWWPFSTEQRRVSYKFLRVYTGKRMERWVVYPISVLALYGAVFLTLALWVP